MHPLDTACSRRVVVGHACKQRNFVQNRVDFAALCHDDDANVRDASWCTTLTCPVGIRRPSAAGSFDAVRARHMSKVHDATIGRPLHDRTPSPTAHDPHDHNAHACEERRKSTRAMQWTCLGVRGGGVSCATSAKQARRGGATTYRVSMSRPLRAPEAMGSGETAVDITSVLRPNHAAERPLTE